MATSKSGTHFCSTHFGSWKIWNMQISCYPIDEKISFSIQFVCHVHDWWSMDIEFPNQHRTEHETLIAHSFAGVRVDWWDFANNSAFYMNQFKCWSPEEISVNNTNFNGDNMYLLWLNAKKNIPSYISVSLSLSLGLAHTSTPTWTVSGFLLPIFTIFPRGLWSVCAFWMTAVRQAHVFWDLFPVTCDKSTLTMTSMTNAEKCHRNEMKMASEQRISTGRNCCHSEYEIKYATLERSECRRSSSEPWKGNTTLIQRILYIYNQRENKEGMSMQRHRNRVRSYSSVSVRAQI